MTVRAFVAALAFTVGLVQAPAFALPVPLSTTEELILNFDMTSQAASFDTIVTQTDLSGVLSLQLTVYGGLDGVDVLDSDTLQGFPLGQVSLLLDAPLYTAALDGLFSIGLRLIESQTDVIAEVAAATAIGNGQTAFINATTGGAGTTVPEPATALLLGVGLAGLAVWRHTR